MKPLKPTTNLERTPGTPARIKDLGLSKKLNRRVFAQVQECYWNARRALTRDALGVDARYVEGCAVMDVAPIVFDHAWVELGDGTIVDPTLMGEGFQYYGAWTYGRADCIAFDRTHPEHGPFWGTKFGGTFSYLGEPEYQRSRIRAQLGAGYPPEMVMAICRSFEAQVMLVFQEQGLDYDLEQANAVADFLTGKTVNMEKLKGVK